MIALQRVYEHHKTHGTHFLVERLWPRGISKEAARLSGWLKELAPSSTLRQWYGHDPDRWPEFQRRYAAELREPEKEVLLRHLADKARKGPVTFVFAASDTERNSAVVLEAIVLRRLKGPGPRARKASGRGKA